MNKRNFFFLSLGLAVLAIVLDKAGMSQYSRDASIVARSVVLPESKCMVMKTEAQTYRSRRTIFSIIELVFALANLVFVIVSARKQELARRSYAITLLIFYVMLQLTLK